MTALIDLNRPLILEEVEKLTIAIFDSMANIESIEAEMSLVKFQRALVESINFIVNTSQLDQKNIYS